MYAEDLILLHFSVPTTAHSPGTGAWVRSHQRAAGRGHFTASPRSSTRRGYAPFAAVDPTPQTSTAAAFPRKRWAPKTASSPDSGWRLWCLVVGRAAFLPPELSSYPVVSPEHLRFSAGLARLSCRSPSCLHLPSALPFALDELRVTTAALPPASPKPSTPHHLAPNHRPASLRTTNVKLLLLDTRAAALERRPLILRRWSVQAERWVIERPEADGDRGGIQPPWCTQSWLHLLGYPLTIPF